MELEYIHRDGQPDPDWLRQQRIEAVTHFMLKAATFAIKAPIMVSVALYEAYTADIDKGI